MDSIVQIFRLFFAGGALPLGVARRAYTALWLILAGAVGIVLVGWGCNLAGYKGVSIALSLLLTVLVTIFWFEPVKVSIVAGVGAVAGALPGVHGNPLSVTQKLLSIYVDILGKVLLWGSILLFITGTVPLGEKPSAIFGITAGILLLALIQWQWKAKTWWKYVFYLYVVAMITGFAATLVPGPIWVKYTPLEGNPVYEIGTTQTEKTLFEIKREQAKNKEEAENNILQGILAKVRRKEKLTPEEEKHLQKKEPPPAKVIQASAVPLAPVAPPPVQEVACDNPSALATRNCLLNTRFSNWMKPAEGTANDGMNICYSDSELVEYESVISHGISLYRFRAKQGQVLMSYKFFKLPEGTLCPQGVV